MHDYSTAYSRSYATTVISLQCVVQRHVNSQMVASKILERAPSKGCGGVRTVYHIGVSAWMAHTREGGTMTVGHAYRVIRGAV